MAQVGLVINFCEQSLREENSRGPRVALYFLPRENSCHSVKIDRQTQSLDNPGGLLRAAIWGHIRKNCPLYMTPFTSMIPMQPYILN